MKFVVSDQLKHKNRLVPAGCPNIEAPAGEEDGGFSIKGHPTDGRQRAVSGGPQKSAVTQSAGQHKLVFELRFRSYVRSLLHYAAIDYFRTERRYQTRNLLILDGPASMQGEQDDCWKDRLLSPDMAIEEAGTTYCCIGEELVQPELYEVFKLLTERQRLILTLSYGECRTDREIGLQMGVSQQAVNKSKRAALDKLKRGSSVKGDEGNGRR